MSFVTPPSTDLASFRKHLASSERIPALCGAGLSAASGLPTFRGAGGLWRTHKPTKLATPGAFASDPGLVWQFYSHRRHLALAAEPNRAHKALAALARRCRGFLTLTQNVDGLSARAGHPEAQLHLLHGSLFDVKCVDEGECGYVERGNTADPIVPALAHPRAAKAGPTSSVGSSAGQDLNIADATVPLRSVPADELPHCPRCKKALLRPGVV